MKIASFNVNSLRVRTEIVAQWLKNNQPDVLCVQETKVQDVDFPAEPFEQIGYKCAFKGQKSYNGVAIFSKTDVENIGFGFEDEPTDKPRLVRGKIGSVNIVNTYIPQGYQRDSEKFEYKLNWFGRLKSYFAENFKPTEQILWMGDLNVAPQAIDVYDPEGLAGSVCFCPEITLAFNNVVEWGFTDLFRMHCKEAGQYTFWDYRIRAALKRNLGWRLDHIMATKCLADKCTACYVDKEPRASERPSDHTPIVAEFDLNL